MEKNTNKKSASALIGAAFLMATSAIVLDFLHRPDSSQETSKEALAS